ncbi:FG-GAP repeat protein [Candidatus Sumerlaeota bacterium]|nr:FG-GAP repeat protein [Candidatus Sumerlaeota bacterium]
MSYSKSRLWNLVILFVMFMTLPLAFCLEKTETQMEGPDWTQEAIKQLQEEEYEVTWQENCVISEGKAGYHIVNRKQNLRLYFYSEGVKAIRRTEAKPTWILGWSVAGIGANGIKSPETSEMRIEKNILEYKRGNILEQYENLTSGVKARFVIQEPTKGSDSLAIAILFNGSLTPKFVSGDSKVEFYMDEKALVSFRDFKAEDAQGNNLNLQISLDNNELQIQVKDKEAVYPVNVGFLLSSLPPWTAESDQEGAQFGLSVSGAGDVNGDGFSDVIIGSPKYDNGQTDEGCAYVYYGGAAGPGSSSNWRFEGNQQSAKLGYAVSTAGDVNKDGYSDVIISAPGYSNDQAIEGRVFVFYGGSGGLGIIPSILESNQSSSHFGGSVSTAGDVNGDGYSDVIVGADNYQETFQVEGKVFVFHGSGSGISISPSWSAVGGKEQTSFGMSVRFAGDVNKDGYSDVIIGAPYYDNTLLNRGKVFVYYGSGTGLESSPAWEKEGGATDEYLGYSVSGAGDVDGDAYADVIIGAPGFSNEQVIEGAAIVYYSSASGLSASPDWMVESNHAGEYFGNSVSTAGDMDGDGFADVIVGAYSYTCGETDEGAVYVFKGDQYGLKTSWHSRWEPNQANANYGYCVSFAGDVNGDGLSDVIVGALAYDSGQTDEGKCFLYYGEREMPESISSWTKESDQANSEFGQTVACAGDINGDGYSDVILAAPYYDNGEINEGRIYVYLGQVNDELMDIPFITLEGNEDYANFGYSVACAGDVNNDGFDDIIVGAPGHTSYTGKAFIYGGSSGAMSGTPIWEKSGPAASSRFGMSVAWAGDVNGDGYSDVIIGAPYYSNSRGQAQVYWGGSEALGANPMWTFTGIQAGDYFGNSVASAGDVNGDGFSDVIVGAPEYTNGQDIEGAVYVFHGSINGVHTTADWKTESDQFDAMFGDSVSSAGDVNGDGYSDVIIGAPYYSCGETNEGSAFVFLGSSGGLEASYSWQGQCNQELARYGNSVACVGDVNGDGFSDVIVGAYLRDSSIYIPMMKPSIKIEDAGAAYIYFGSPDGTSPSSDWHISLLQTNANFGRCVASAGDVNGDGFSDVIVGCPGYKPDTSKVGRAYFYLGNGGLNRVITPKQYSPDPYQPIGRLERAVDNRHCISYKVFSPFGRGKVAQEIEIKRFGKILDGGDTIVSKPWYDLETGGVSYTQQFINQPEYVLFHWRARVVYDPVSIPWQSHGPWISIPYNGWQEADFRTGLNPYWGIEEIIGYILGRSGYPHDVNNDCKVDAADVIEFLIP